LEFMSAWVLSNTFTTIPYACPCRIFKKTFRIGTIDLDEAGQLSDELLALVRGWVKRVVQSVTKALFQSH
jgi:hypothetical protein